MPPSAKPAPGAARSLPGGRSDLGPYRPLAEAQDQRRGARTTVVDAHQAGRARRRDALLTPEPRPNGESDRPWPDQTQRDGAIRE